MPEDNIICPHYLQLLKKHEYSMCGLGFTVVMISRFHCLNWKEPENVTLFRIKLILAYCFMEGRQLRI